MSTFSKFSIIALLLLLPNIIFAQNRELNLIPQPNSVEVKEGYFILDNNVGLYGNANFAKEYLTDKIFKSSGIKLKDGVGEKSITIDINPSCNIKSEGYNLIVENSNIKILAPDNGGAFYAIQTLLQLMPPTIYGKSTGWEEWNIPCLEINDAPRFGYRGVMLDVSRTFFGLDVIYNLLDWLSYHKLNKFHWHLSDDNGWRIEIKKYPSLTSKGAWRGPNEVIPPSYGSGNKRYGGFYTQEEVKKVIKYAADRNIEIIPEIDMPGHSKALIGCYPECGCNIKEEFVSVNGEVKNVWCVGREANYKVLENIIKELAQLFPSKYIHIGGDEVNMNNWKACPECQKLMQKEGMQKEVELLNYFVRRLEKIINKHGKSMAGWDEILDGGDLMPSSRVYAWRSVKRGIESVTKGQPTVLQVAEYCYLDMKQSPLERGHNWAGIVTLEKTYSLDPISTFKLNKEQESLILGTQVALWTELLNRPARFLEYQYFPRVAAISEVAWSKKEDKDYDKFYYKLTKTHYDRMFNMGIAFRLPYPEVTYENNRLIVKAPYPWAAVRYTIDGSEPTSTSNIYSGEIITFEPEKFRFATFYKDIIKSITVAASNIELYSYITPKVSIKSSFEEKYWAQRQGVENITNYKFSNTFRVNRTAKEGDYVEYIFDKPVKCKSITVDTGIPNISFYSVTEGYVEYSYNGIDYIKGDEFKLGTSTIYPKESVKSVRIKVTGDSDALTICFQNLKIIE